MSANSENLQPDTEAVLQAESAERIEPDPPVAVRVVGPTRVQNLPRKAVGTITRDVPPAVINPNGQNVTKAVQLLGRDHRRAGATLIGNGGFYVAYDEASKEDLSRMAWWPANVPLKVGHDQAVWALGCGPVDDVPDSRYILSQPMTSGGGLTLTIPAVPGKTAYLTGYSATWDATATGTVNTTLTILGTVLNSSGIARVCFTPTGQLIEQFPAPLPASGPNQSIVFAISADANNPGGRVIAHGFYSAGTRISVTPEMWAAGEAGTD